MTQLNSEQNLYRNILRCKREEVEGGERNVRFLNRLAQGELDEKPDGLWVTRHSEGTCTGCTDGHCVVVRPAGVTIRLKWQLDHPGHLTDWLNKWQSNVWRFLDSTTTEISLRATLRCKQVSAARTARTARTAPSHYRTVHSQKLTVPQLVNKLSTFYGTQRFITLLTKVPNLNYTNPSQKFSFCFTCMKWSEMVRGSVKLWEVLWNGERFCEIVRGSVKWWEVLWNCEKFCEMVRGSVKLWEVLWNCERFCEIVRGSVKLWEVLW